MIRHLYLILDFSRSIEERDLYPNRLEVTQSLIEPFIIEYFDQNPISQLAVIVARHGGAIKCTELSGHPSEHVSAVKRESAETGGEFSLQNSLDLAYQSLIQLASQGNSREILVIMSSLTSCDPGNLLDLLKSLKKDQIRVSIIGLSAEVAICMKFCRETQGIYRVILNETHYKELLWEHLVPPTVYSSQLEPKLMMMGFPGRSIDSTSATFCVCHSGRRTAGGYECPRCLCKVCELPIDCPVCGLTLVSSAHLARSYHHLFPVAMFREVTLGPESLCSACHEVCEGNIGFQCNSCTQIFCIICDLFIHEVLHNCPGCPEKTMLTYSF